MTPQDLDIELDDMLIHAIPTELLYPNPYNEELYGPPEVDQEFLATIAEDGIRQPLTVYADPVNIGDGYYIAGGCRRHLAAQVLHLQTCPSNIVEVDTADDAAVRRLVVRLNQQREKTLAMKVREFHVLETQWEATDTLADMAERLGVAYREAKRIHVVFGTRYRQRILTELKLRAAQERKVLAAWEEIRTDALAEKISLKVAEERVYDLVATYRGDTRQQHRRTATAEQRPMRAPAFVLCQLTDGRTFTSFERLTSGELTVDLGIVSGGVTQQIALQTDAGVVVLDAEILIRKFLLPALRHAPATGSAAGNTV